MARARRLAAFVSPQLTVWTSRLSTGKDAVACACAEAARRAEPTRDEFEGAVAEATRELEDAVRGINDALEELRYELEDEA